MALSDFDTPSEWADDLDRRWPERKMLQTLLVDTIRREYEQRPQTRLLELGIGDGRLLQSISNVLPNAHLIGVDIQSVLVEHASQIIEQGDFREHDLNDTAWWSTLNQSIDAAFSLQSFHDLGGYEALRNIYQRIHEVLAPGGRLLNADFVVPQAHDNPDKPRRFAYSVHEALLQEIGFSEVACLGSAGDLACVSARK
ncbi:MAG: class I SAM-dependent methyltransferase [Pseudomonadota bacterium]